MIIQVNKLPSGGYGTMTNSIDVRPLTYSELLRYRENRRSNPNLALLDDINMLVDKIPMGNTLNVFDLNSIIFTRKLITCTPNNNLTIVTNTGRTVGIDITKIEFRELDKSLLDINTIKLNDHEYYFNLPSIAYFRDCLADITTRDQDLDTKLIYLMSFIDYLSNKDQVYNDVINAKFSEITLLESIYSKFIDQIKPYTVEGGAVINLNENITDIFRLVQLNCPITEDILTSK